MKIRPVLAQLFHADRRTEMTKLRVAFRNFASAPKNFPVGFVYLDSGLQVRSQQASGRSCDRRSRSSFAVVFPGPRANFESALIFHAALQCLSRSLSPKLA